MTRRWRGIGVVLLASLVSVAHPAKAEQPVETTDAGGLQLPPAFELLEALERVHQRTRSPLWQCSGSSEALCPCVRIEGDEVGVVLVGVDVSPETLRVAELRIESANSRWVARDVVMQRDGQLGSVASLRETRWRGRGSDEVIVADDLVADWEAHRLKLTSVRWLRAGESFPDDRPLACDAEPDGALAIPWSDGATVQLDEATYTRQGGWQLGSARVGRKLPLARPPVPGRRVSGLLPPALRVAPAAAQLELGYYLAGPSLMARASMDSTRIVGVGLSYVAQPVTCEPERCRLRALHLDAAMGSGARLALGADGHVSAGEERRHVGLSLETWTLWGEADVAGWNRRRLERNALLRNWRLQRAGASWGGADSTLQVSAAHADLPYAGVDATARMANASALDVVYGGGADLGKARADLRLYHAERRDELASGRAGGAHLGVHRTFGDAGRIWARPRVNVGLAWADLRADEADALPGGPGSAISADVMVDAGMALRARFGPAGHAFSPRLILGRRQSAGDVMNLEGSSDSLASGWLLQRDTSFNLVGAVVDQALVFGQGWALALPLGVMLTDDGQARNWEPTYQGSLRLAAPVLRRLVVRADAMCRGRCDELSFAARVEVAWFGPIRSRHVLWRGRGYQPTSPFFDTRYRTDYVRGWRVTSDPGDRGIFHTSAFFTSWQRWAAELRLHGDVQTPTERGGEVTLRYGWPELGWALSLKAAAWPVVGRWAGFVGFSLL